jgi:hypothetical protein
MMSVKATVFRQNLFRYMDECYRSSSPLIIERGRERFVLKPQVVRKPIGSITPRLWIAPDLDSLPDFSPSEWAADDLS